MRVQARCFLQRSHSCPSSVFCPPRCLHQNSSACVRRCGARRSSVAAASCGSGGRRLGMAARCDRRLLHLAPTRSALRVSVSASEAEAPRNLVPQLSQLAAGRGRRPQAAAIHAASCGTWARVRRELRADGAGSCGRRERRASRGRWMWPWLFLQREAEKVTLGSASRRRWTLMLRMADAFLLRVGVAADACRRPLHSSAKSPARAYQE